MTLDDAIEHGRAWVAAGWTWAPGQVAISWVDGLERHACIGVVTAITHDGSIIGFAHIGGGHGPLPMMVPDLRDRGTLGHALGQVRDAWGDRHLHVVPWKCRRPVNPEFSHKVGFYLCRIGGAPLDCARVGYSEAEALLAARRAAP